MKPSTYSETERYLLTTARALHGKPIATITRRDIAEVLSGAATKVTKGTGEVTANRLRATLSTLFTWSMKEGLVEVNPTIGTHRRAESVRKRTLVDPERAIGLPVIRCLWAATSR